MWGAPIHVLPGEWRKSRSRQFCSSAQFPMSPTVHTIRPHVFLSAASVVLHAVLVLSRMRLARFTFARISWAVLVHTKGVGRALR